MTLNVMVTKVEGWGNWAAKIFIDLLDVIIGRIFGKDNVKPSSGYGECLGLGRSSQT